MIYELIDNVMQDLQDPVVGLDSHVVAANAAHGTLVPSIVEWLDWDGTKLPSEMEMPAFQIVWDGTHNIRAISQAQREAKHLLRFQLWINESIPDGRKVLTIYAEAILNWLDAYLDDDSRKGTMVEMETPSFSVDGWRTQGRIYMFMDFNFIAKERDVTP